MSQLYPFEGDEVRIREFKVLDRVIDKEDEAVLFKARIKMEAIFDEHALANVPASAAAIALVHESKQRVEANGPNTTKLTIGRKYSATWCQFKAGKRKVELAAASIVLKPNVKVVEGKPSLHWVFEANVDQKQSASLIHMVEADGVKLFTKSLQKDLFNLEGEAAA